MSLRINFLLPNILQHPHKFHAYQPIININRPKIQIACTNTNNNHSSTNKKNSITDADLASDLASEVEKINTQLVEREEAMKKSKKMLFSEFCEHAAMDEEEVRRKWSRMEQEEKWVLIKGFVHDWDTYFHPLSARSVKEMIEEYVHGEEKKRKRSIEDADDDFDSSSSMFFPAGLKRIMGFSQK